MSGARAVAMAFYVYMLTCADWSLYVGHTQDLEARLSAHRLRTYSGFTASRLPVNLIYSEQFSTRDEAFAAERRIKRWSRRKKLALAHGAWGEVQRLAAIRSPERRLSGG